MYQTAGIRFARTKVMLMGGGMLGAMLMVAPSVALAQAVAANNVETVTVTGYAASLQKATEAKRDSTNFVDTVFAEDIGKFPDTNIAESLNRIPGVTISREIDGEGVNASIRGLGTSFTKVTLNGSNVAVASTGATDNANANREVDLNWFPTELFTQLSVAKSPTADMLEGGAAGNINLRSARPFDHEGFRITYNLQGSKYSASSSMGERGALIISDTWGSFGALIGVAGVQNKIFTKGWEDGNAGWGSPGPLTATQCPAANCDTLGANFYALPATVPANVTTGGLVPGETLTGARLSQLNPGLTPQQISNILLPRLGRSMYERGSRDRFNGVASFEWRPTEDLHFYLDMVGGRAYNDMDRSDLALGVRAGNGAQPLIPINVVLDPLSQTQIGQGATPSAGIGGVVQSGTFANAQFHSEARPYKENGDFFSINPGGSWHINDLMNLEFQANASRSHFFRDSPTYMVVTCPSGGNATGVPGCAAPAGGVFATFNNPPGAAFPIITPSIDINNPANFQWNNGRTNLQDEKRFTQTSGAHVDFTWGGSRIALKVGAAYDSAFRAITAIDGSQIMQNAVCGDNPNVFLPPPNTQPVCRGLNVAGNIATVNAASPGQSPTYPGYGTGYSAGFPAFNYGGSLVPQSAVAGFIKQGPTGFITEDYAALAAASNYYAIDRAAINSVANAHAGVTETYPFAVGATSGGNSGTIQENVYSWYGEVAGTEPIHGHNLRYNLGLRFVETHQYITSPVTIVDPRNSTLTDGGLYPNTFKFATQTKEYGTFLPSINAVYEVTDDFQVRGSLSRTMTRANPNQMISGVNFGDVTAQAITLGNPQLKPFYSNNIDVGFELYTGGAGYFGFTAFRKGVSGFPIQQNTTQPFSYLQQFGINYNTLTPGQQLAIQGRGCSSDANCAAQITVTQNINASGMLTINGLELDYVQPLDFLLDDYGLPGFGFTGNLTLLDQKSSGSAPTFATGVPPMSYNVTGYYDHNGISVRLSYVWNDTAYASGSNSQSLCLPNTNASVSGCPQGAYLFQKSYGQADFSSSVRLSNFLGDIPTDPELTFDVQNLFNSKLRAYDQWVTATHNYYDQGQVVIFGVRGTW
ncbi:MAG: TonB-dependent receptor [Alphaproteobacteria bacterium]|nr:TonB-dependent receptor [Alphaproteobacteria bacterium]